MAKQLDKNYNPAEVDDRIYQNWMKKGYFHADSSTGKKPYTIVMPPPNITGQLHMGHALDNTLQDILIRFKRMSGYCALWLPGTDHASIATEAKIVEQMNKEGFTKEGIGREKFLERAWSWKEQYGGRICEQLKKMGSSRDWDRLRFTMDKGCNDAVNEVFVRLYNKGLIYRGERIINWCPHCLTSISDAEVEYEEQAGHFWHLRYQLSDKSGYINLATTRPETLLGDTAVAVNPNDERYKDLIGKTVILPIVHREIPIVADEYVEMDFGTGVVKITPAHDPNDFEVGLRHNLPVINVMTDDAKITEDYPKYAGMDRFEARKAIVEDLEKEGALVKIEDYAHNVGTCYRCGTTVEPRVSKQWFVSMKPLAKPAIEKVKNGDTKFVPERFDKIYFHWLENIRDWCISRQLWWGHRIPAYYCDTCGEIVVSKDEVTVCPKCSKPMRRDEDTLDTWFSSALWPFSTLGWPNETEDLKYFYPTDTLVTGYDIIPFWVMRMMFSGIEQTGQVPFDTVLIHGLVRDAQGRKMSKSLGNGIDPLLIIEQYGADALRFMLATGNSPGNDMRFIEEKVLAARNFANKIWNASRFVLMNLEIEEVSLPDDLLLEDKWILSRLNKTVKEVNENLERFEIGIAATKLYDFAWDDFCDWYIELVKPRLFETNTNEATKKSAQQVLLYVLTDILKALHPFMPFITEEIYQNIPHTKESIMIDDYPVFRNELVFDAEEAEMNKVMDLIKAVRNRRSEMNIAPSKKAHLYIETENTELFEKGKGYYERLASASGVTVGDSFDIQNAVTIVTDGAKTYIPLAELVDISAELDRMAKEKEKLLSEIKRVDGMLSNEGFVSKAPAAKIEAEKAKKEKFVAMLEALEKSIEELKNM